MTPMPPACAIAIASRASVTVSMAEETIGRLSRIVRVSRVPISAALGMIALMARAEQHVVEREPLGKSGLNVRHRRHPSTLRHGAGLHPSYGAAA